MEELIITTSDIKKQLLLKRSKESIISNTKIMTKKEAYDSVLGTISNEALVKLSKEFNLDILTSKVYLENVLYNSDKLKVYYDYLLKENLINKNSYIKVNKIHVINVILDDFIINYFKDSKVTYEQKEYKHQHLVYSFDNTEEEISFIAKYIIKESLDLNKVKLVNVKSENINVLKKIFNMYNLPINIDDSTSILKTKSFIKFYNELQISKDINKALSYINKGDVYLKIINYFNDHNYRAFDELELLAIKEDFKQIKIRENKNDNAINIIDFYDVYDESNYYFLMTFDDTLPRKYKDEDFYLDEEKIKLNILTSYNKNLLEKNLFLQIFNSTKNLVVTYSNKSTFTSYNKSNIISDYNLEVIKINQDNYTYSDKYNKYELSKKLDEFIKYGSSSEELNLLSSNYNIPYLSYNNKFTGIDKKYVNYPITLSYSSTKTYCECAFKYYIDKILRIKKIEKNSAADIGTIFHNVLSKMYDEDFDFSSCYEEETSKFDKTLKDKFFIENLKIELVKIIDFLNEFNSHTSLNQNICEKEFLIENIIPNKLNFKGYIDNIKYSEKDKLMALIDYKTGFVETSLDNLNYGFNLQLPSYLYLTSETMKDYKTIGIYLDKILDAPSTSESEKDIKNKLKFEGYSTTNEKDLEKLDSGYANSMYIKSLKLSKSGFYFYSKVLDENNLIKIKDIAKDKILEVGENILEAKFEINPKEITGKVEKCKYCKYKDICYMQNKDVVKLENTKLIDLL